MGVPSGIELIVILSAILLFIRYKNKIKPGNEIEYTKNMLKHRSFLESNWKEFKSNPQKYPEWFQDPFTKRQKEKLRDLGVPHDKTITKKQASDLIGLFNDPRDEDDEILDFFGVDPDNHNETTARYKVREIFLDKNNYRKWEEYQDS